MNQQLNTTAKPPSPEHWQGVVNRLSQTIASMTVEKSSLAELVVEKNREIMELKAEIADLQDRLQPEQEAKMASGE